MNELMISWKKESNDKKIQYCCVLAVLLVEWMYFSPPVLDTGAAALSVDYFLVIPSGLFLLLTLRRGINRKGKAPFILGFLMLAWAVAVEVLRILFGIKCFAPGVAACNYALALPMAFALEDERRQWGITAFALLYVLTGVRLCVQAIGLIFEILPQPYSTFVCWDGARLRQMFHPTSCAALLMLGMGFCLALCSRTKKRWLRGLLIVLVIVQFVIQSMTNGRNAVGFTSLMLGGILFCAIRGSGWKRLPVALAVGAALTAVLFLSSQTMYSMHERQMYNEAVRQAQITRTEENAAASQAEAQEADNEVQTASQAEPGGFLDQAGEMLAQIDEHAVLTAENVQKSLREDLFSFNGRTTIWAEAVAGALRHPLILLCGTDSMAEILAEGGKTRAEHTHNSCLETLYTFGLPGMVLALAITLLTLRAGVIVLWRNTDLWKSSVAVIALGLLGSSILEPYLFAAKNYHHYFCVIFLVTVGYLHQWSLEK